MSFNYAGPGAVVGIQGSNIVVSGGIVFDGKTVTAGDVITDGDQADGEDD